MKDSKNGNSGKNEVGSGRPRGTAPTGAGGMKIAYIAHPIGGDVERNLECVKRIARHINMTLPGIVPFVPYYCDCLALDDSDERERARGIANDLAILRSGCVDYLWLYGPRISKGMWQEIAVAQKYGIEIMPMTLETWHGFFGEEWKPENGGPTPGPSQGGEKIKPLTSKE